MKFIHLTDLHLVPSGRRLYGLDPNARLRAAVADINACHGDAEFVLITGDLVHDGEPAAYDAVRCALDQLAVPRHLLIGNHDDRAVFKALFPEAVTDEHGFVQTVVESSAGPFVLLDTHEPGTHQGRLCDKRLAWLDRTLASLRGRDVFLALHHPPLMLNLPAMDQIGLADRADLAGILARHRNVRHIFFGHVHRPVHGAWHGVPFSTQRSLNHQVALHFDEQPGESIPGSHEPPAYAVVLINEGSIVIHVHDLLDAGPRFDLLDARAERADRIGSLPSHFAGATRGGRRIRPV
jgi:3',5'-cyclic-AMP phosphodiesterase